MHSNPTTNRNLWIGLGAGVLCVALLCGYYFESILLTSLLTTFASAIGCRAFDRRLTIGWAGFCLLAYGASFAFSGNSGAEAVSAAVITACVVVIVVANGFTAISARDAVQEIRDFTDSVPPFLWRGRPDGSIDYFNRRYFEITGDDPRDAVATQNWVKHIHPDDLEEFKETWADSVRTLRDVKTLFRVRQRDGQFVWMSGRGFAVRGEDGVVRHWYGGLFDVNAEVLATLEIKRLAGELNERIRIQNNELTLSQERFRTLFEDMNIAYAEQDIRQAKLMIDNAKANGATNFARLAAENPDFIDACIAAVKVNRVNDALLHMMGYADHDELVAKPPSENAVDSRRVMQQQLEAMFYGRNHFATTATLLGKDDRKVTVAVGVNVSEDWSISLSTHIDITDQLQAREQATAAREDLARASQALTIGAVSTSLAHELNQPLLALTMAAQTAKRWLAKSPPQIEEAQVALDRVNSNAERMNLIIKNTRSRLLKGHRDPTAIDLRDLLTETSQLLETALAGRNVSLRLSIPDNAAEVFADRTELQQVFTNLIVNAADAMADMEGKRSIEILARRSPDEQSVIEVRDNGPGINEGGLEQIFQPFFTTKSGGMGMGLQISRSIVEAFGGTLLAKNNEEKGASFILTLPTSDPKETSNERSIA